jgi:DNA-binding response OmpR family regulator
MKILVVDDDPIIREAITVGIGLQWQEATVVAAADGDEGLRRFEDEVPDVVVLDVMLPGRTGLAVLRAIRQVSDVPVILLTARGEEMDQVKGLEAGADDYVVKPFGHLALLARIKAVLRRADLAQPARSLPDVVVGDLTVNFQAQQVTWCGEPVALTAVEYQVLYHLVRNAGRVLPHQALLERVWGPDSLATTDNLKVMISRLRAKLAAPNQPPTIETVRGVGYRFARPAGAPQRSS